MEMFVLIVVSVAVLTFIDGRKASMERMLKARVDNDGEAASGRRRRQQ